MNRQALIIANPGEIGDKHYCEGVNKDVSLYETFLRSPLGGYWQGSEISVLRRPSKVQVRAAMRDVKQAEYSLVIFCGHGGMHSTRGPTILHLREGEELNSEELAENTTKRTVILDCCREIARPSVLAKAALDEAVKALRADPIQCRLFYDSSIEKCPSGLVVLFGCSAGERAGDDSQRGGRYSFNLRDSTVEWADSLNIDITRESRDLSVVEAHERAARSVISGSGGTQHPVIQKPRSGKYFPFGVVA
jgi:hypothetical protein